MAKKMSKRTFPTKYSESVELGTFETFTKPSMTEPDNAMSIPEIIARFTRGYGIEVQQHPWNAGSDFEGEDPDAFFEDFGPAQQPAQQPAEQPVQQLAQQQAQQPAQQPAQQQAQQSAQQQAQQSTQQPAQQQQEGS